MDALSKHSITEKERERLAIFTYELCDQLMKLASRSRQLELRVTWLSNYRDRRKVHPFSFKYKNHLSEATQLLNDQINLVDELLKLLYSMDDFLEFEYDFQQIRQEVYAKGGRLYKLRQSLTVGHYHVYIHEIKRFSDHLNNEIKHLKSYLEANYSQVERLRLYKKAKKKRTSPEENS